MLLIRHPFENGSVYMRHTYGSYAFWTPILHKSHHSPWFLHMSEPVTMCWWLWMWLLHDCCVTWWAARPQQDFLIKRRQQTTILVEHIYHRTRDKFSSSAAWRLNLYSPPAFKSISVLLMTKGLFVLKCSEGQGEEVNAWNLHRLSYLLEHVSLSECEQTWNLTVKLTHLFWT